jgi:hypothetical protein
MRVARIALLLTLIACSTGDEAASLPTIDPSQRLTCSGDDRAVFTIGDLGKVTAAEQMNEPPAEALRAYLASDAGQRFKQDGYRVLSRSPQRMLYASGDAPGDITSILFEQRDGAWVTEGATFCVPTRYRPGSVTGSWTLQEMPTPGALTFTALVSAEPCSGGHSADGRILAPAVEEFERQILVTFFLSPPPANEGSCEETEAVPTTVTLRNRVGKRALMDAGRYPPAPVTGAP